MDADHYDENKPSKFYVQKSLEKTSGKVFFKFVWVFIVFAAVLAPFNAINVNIDNDIAQIKDYFAYETWQIDITDENELWYYEYLKSAFSEISDDQLISNLRTLYVKQIWYGIFFFLLISWVFTMVLTSFYKRALGLQWGKIKEEDQPIKKKSKKKEKVDKSVKKKKTDKWKKKKKTSATKKSKKNTKKK